MPYLDRQSARASSLQGVVWGCGERIASQYSVAAEVGEMYIGLRASGKHVSMSSSTPVAPLTGVLPEPAAESR